MKAENLKKEVHFIGNAKVKKSEDWIHADKIIVYFDDKNETKMYKAIGKVTFEFKNETMSMSQIGAYLSDDDREIRVAARTLVMGFYEKNEKYF